MCTVDPYWSRLVSERFDYEPATALILGCLADIDYVFIDAGANFGYWSVLATSRRFGAKTTVAIEPIGGDVPCARGVRTTGPPRGPQARRGGNGDHGNDASCSTSEFVLGLDASVHFVTKTGEVHRVRTLDDVRRFKPSSRFGYNFVATLRRGAFERRLQHARMEL